MQLVICTKVREGDKRIVTVKEGEITGRHVFIIDDLVKTGTWIRNPLLLAIDLSEPF